MDPLMISGESDMFALASPWRACVRAKTLAVRGSSPSCIAQEAGYCRLGAGSKASAEACWYFEWVDPLEPRPAHLSASLKQVAGVRLHNSVKKMLSGLESCWVLKQLDVKELLCVRGCRGLIWPAKNASRRSRREG